MILEIHLNEKILYVKNTKPEVSMWLCPENPLNMVHFFTPHFGFRWNYNSELLNNLKSITLHADSMLYLGKDGNGWWAVHFLILGFGIRISKQIYF